MVKRIYLLLVIILFVGCSKKLFDLTLSKTPYSGVELRIDGYYYSDEYSIYAAASDDYDSYVDIAVFYRDGFCIHTGTHLNSQEDTLIYIENEILLNEEYISDLKSTPQHIGVFQIRYPDIEFEIWEARTTTFSNYGEILNDSTFIINKKMNNGTGNTYSVNLTYRFKQFSPKPDSTNNFVK
ncbi:MAG: hypothetical protein HN704_03280 [Bacteroidetes bacterium]|jgi:hypothetical protein|nr:hypothetical protein [Bacteroidota bacterium]MBT6686576.1 hypothetical protein [Bacteroidota bacterium]MBT7142939.1 hypothetical protein [Bacteroidota bacterium]MBT7490612.1 hypothetical protein [Bacteroidota bacterium]